MTTRIKYHRTGKNFTSQYYNNYRGERLLVMIHFNDTKSYTMNILNKQGDVLERSVFPTVQKAKRIARKLLINKYEIRLNEEVRNKV